MVERSYSLAYRQNKNDNDQKLQNSETFYVCCGNDDVVESESRQEGNLFSRRGTLKAITSGILAAGLLLNNNANAIGEGSQRMVLTRKPTAPPDALIPTAQQRLLLEKCIVLTSTLRNNSNSETNVQTTIRELQSILPELSSSNNNNKKEKQQQLTIPLNRQQLSGDTVRAAMNVYTSNLRYSDTPKYTVTDDEWKKSFIRSNDGLPTIKQVIVADLDLRDLYRNTVQLKIDDAAAELYMVVAVATNCSVNDDAKELELLLQEAANAFDEWLSRIDDDDVKIAIRAALQGKTIQIFETYNAGFIPK